ncbi:MAG: murein transglycosylase A, partial [Bacteroidota bacterium]
ASFIALLVILGISFHNYSFLVESPDAAEAEVCFDLPTETYSDTDNSGKLEDADRLPEIFTPSEWDELGFPVISEKLAIGLQHQLRVLKATGSQDKERAGNLSIRVGEMKAVIDILLKNKGMQPKDLNQYLDAYQVWGGDKEGNVKFTGYFTPVVKVRKEKTGKYKYPIYAYPEDWQGQLPSRREIDAKGALAGKGYELAYAANKVDVYIMQLQGSGWVQFQETGERQLFTYAGQNCHPYRNIEKFFKSRSYLGVQNVSLDNISRYLAKNPQMVDSVLFYNPSYTFFLPKKGLAKGAGMVPLLEDISIAADPRFFPLGSVVLAAFPVVKNGKVSHHEYRIFLPQDTGGAIKGAGHVDVYSGNGDLGLAKASALHHYGRLWILKPKKDERVALNEAF